MERNIQESVCHTSIPTYTKIAIYLYMLRTLQIESNVPA